MITDVELQRIVGALSKRYNTEVVVTDERAPLDGCGNCLSHNNMPIRNLLHRTTITGIYYCLRCGHWWITAWPAKQPTRRAQTLAECIDEILAEMRD